ncbi:MAG TPA: DNA mismatch repair protein MutS [Pyrinomonadaceae bacterium]|nr:DNA mismatch repair protein MutS [Pyrinomonadaceae bacterium]
MENVTPMLRQYLEIKKNYPGTILFFRLGDFYEMFNEDAIVGSRELEITLTARQKDSPNPLPMCGVPHHAAAGYIARLVKKGYRVAICEQAEAAGKGVKLVKREVVRVITPGTAIDSQLSESRESNFLAGVSGSVDRVGVAFLELSTGSFQATEFSGANAWPRAVEQIESFSTRELLFNEELKQQVRGSFLKESDQPLLNDRARAAGRPGLTITEVEESLSTREATDVLASHFNTRDVAGFGLEGRPDALRAAVICLNYAKQTQKAAAEHITAISYYDSSEFMVLDSVTLRNLDLVDTRSDNNKHTLLKVIDETVTSMGGRLLRAWLVRPSIKRSEIQTRQAAVTELSDSILREKLRFLMKEVSDLERLVGRLNLGNASPRDLLALRRSLGQVPEINLHLADSRSLLLQVLAENIFELPELSDLIDRSIADEPPLNLSDGGVIRDGFNPELDDLRQISRSGKQTIASFEESERHRSGIPTLKVRFNNVFGYYIEISKAQLARVPEDYERRQTLANAERFTTPQLKEWEQKVLGAEEKIVQLESDLFEQVRQSAKAETQRLQSTARAIATLDALASLAETATKRNYVCPTLHDGDDIEIKNGRHPVVEAFIGDSFVPNDSYLNNSTDRLLIVTGANMGGKSTILRQIALIQILAQIGSFVPAASARLPIVDRVWTRVGASDDLASGRSTFMVEMTETAAILHNATSRSLILLDEIGRGTSTFDGLSIAWAVAEYLHNSTDHSAKTLFATHYHELTELAEHLPGAKNYQITASEKDGDVVFLHKLAKGKASKSYGVAVAKLAGLPAAVIERSKEVLAKLEQYELAVFADEGRKGLAMAAGKDVASQFSLFAISNESAIDELRSIEIESLSAEDSKNLLLSLKSKIV